MGAEDKKTSRILSIVGLFLVAIIWGSTFTANKIALGSLTPLSLMALRFMIAFLLMFIIFRKRFKGLTIKDCIGGILCGVALFIAFVFQTNGLLYTDAGKQAFLSGSYVIVVPFLTWIIFKNRPNVKTYIGALLCFYGISLLSLNKDLSIGIGDTLTLVSSVFFAAQIVIAGYFIRKEDAAVMSTVQFGVMGILSMLLVLINGDTSYTSVFTNIFSVSSLAIIYLGVFGTAVAYYLQVLCQKYTSPTTTSIILSMEAVFGTIIAVIILGEIFTPKMLVGAIVIFISIIVTELEFDLIGKIKKFIKI